MSGRLARMLVLCGAVGAVASSSLASQAADHGCKVTSRSEELVVLVCPKGLKLEAWRDASVQACETRKVCNVWIWDNPADAPANSPAKDSDIPRASVDKVKAVWVNGVARMLQVTKKPAAN